MTALLIITALLLVALVAAIVMAWKDAFGRFSLWVFTAVLIFLVLDAMWLWPGWVRLAVFPPAPKVEIAALTGCADKTSLTPDGIYPVYQAGQTIKVGSQSYLCIGNPTTGEYTWVVVTEATPLPATAEPTATPILTTLLICPPASAGTNPVTGDPLIATLNPYPGVKCEYEYVNEFDDVIVNIPDGMAALIADWGVTCPEGALCEGVWVAATSFRLPAGVLVHVYLYASAEGAQGRFPSFASEYVAQAGHTSANVRVPSWATENGNVDGYVVVK